MNINTRMAMVIFLTLSMAVMSCAVGSGEVKKDSPVAEARTDSNVVKNLSAAGDKEKVDVVLEAAKPIRYTIYKLQDPDRIVVDMSRTDISKFSAPITVNKEPVSEVRPSYFTKADDSRLEIALNGAASYEVDNSVPTRLSVTISKKIDEKTGDVAKPVAAESKQQENAPLKAEEAKPADIVVAQPDENTNRLQNVKFHQVGQLSRIEMTMTRPEPSYELLKRDKMNRLTVDLPNTVVDKKDEKLINVSVENSKIKNIASFQFRGGKDPMAKVVVNLDEMSLYNIYSQGNKIVLDIGEEAALAMATEASEKKQEKMAEKEEVAPHPQFTGQKISLDFQKADIHHLLRALADASGFNIIISDKVKVPQVSIKLKDVPWDQALDAILKNNGLDAVREENIIRVATMDEIAKEKETAGKIKDAESKIVQLYHQIFQVNYESAENMKKNLENLKSERGSVEINSRTNTIIVTDSKEKLAEMASLIAKLDRREKQVLIEARIVEVSHNASKELGVQWGGYYAGVTNSAFPNTIGVTGGAGASPNIGLGGSIVNLPTSATSGGIGLTLGHVNGTAILDAKLMAMETSGDGRIISMPKITTMNNKEALIESGREIPYMTTSTSGTKTEFKKATLSLKVTPHITPDNYVRLEIQTNKDEADFTTKVTADAPPSIITKKANTEVLVPDGDTTVIGGLFKDNDSTSKNKVPGFGDLPILGYLFRSTSTKSQGEELLIFLTPKIID